MQNTSDQLQMFKEEDLNAQTLSLSEALAKILAWLENEKGWKGKEVLLSSTPSDLSGSADRMFLSGKMLKGHTPQMLAQTLGQLSKPLPTLGTIDLNGNCLIHPGFYPKIESGYTLSDILEKDVDQTYFLSQKMVDYLTSRTGQDRAGQRRPQAENSTTIRAGNMRADDTFICVAQRGRNPENPSDRSTGAHTEQRLEPNSQGTTNTLTGVQKDNYIMVKQIGSNNKSNSKTQPYQQDKVYDSTGLSPALNKGKCDLIIKTNTKSGEEVATEGDSINFSNLTSKTRRGRVGKGKAQTIDTSCSQAVIAAHNEENINSGIRRLTEIECERLQGFSDRWTEFGDYDGVIKPIPKTQRYKMLGNAVTSDVVKCIGLRLLSINS